MLTAAQWTLLVAGTAAAAGYALWLYLRREVPGPGRPALALLRTSTVGLLLLLLLDPSVPGEAARAGEGATWVALDRSLSMGAAPEGGTAPWAAAVERARELQGGGATVAAFGETLRFAAEDPGLLERAPDASASRLAPLLERALEAGAAEVVVLSDLRFDDPASVRRVLEQGGLRVRFEEMGGDPVNAGVARWSVPAAAEGGEPLGAELDVYGSAAAAGRTAVVEVREGERLVATRDVTLPEAGLVASVRLDLPAPAAGGTVRYEARVRLAGDALPDDDARAGYTAVDPEEGLLVAVALAPDWELRFLLPVLEQVTGLTSRGYVRVADGRFLPTGGDAESGPVDADEVRRRVEAAEIVVLQGLTGADPAWLVEAAGRGRAVVFAGDPEGAAAAGIPVQPPVAGEWYLTAEPPPSAIAAELGGAGWQGLPPLTAVMPPADPRAGDAPLSVSPRGSSGESPALLLAQGGEGRTALVLASGFWRWAFREGGPRDAYRRLWAGVAGWLLEDRAVAGRAPVRPAERIFARGEPVRWLAPGLPGSELSLTILRGDSAVADSVWTVPDGGSFETGALPPGVYAYRGAPTSGEGEPAEGSFEVEAHTAELRQARAQDLLAVEPVEGAEPVRAAALRPLRTHPLPYLLLLMLLCGEWIWRRRKGLR